MGKDVESEVRRLGGVACLDRLRARGIGRADILQARRDGLVIKVRRGWCAVRDADARLVEAVRMRGQLTCISATAAMGIWTLEDERLHVACPGNGSRLNPRHDSAPPALDDPAVVVHWGRSTRARTLARQSLRDVVLHVVACQPPERALAVLDSLLQKGRCTRAWLESVLSESAQGSLLRPHVVDDAGSGLESMTRWGFIQEDIPFRTQVWIPGLGPRDFLVGERLLVEIDGREHHATVEGFERDRRLDREAQAIGYDLLRFTSVDVVHQWPRMLGTIHRYMAAGLHLGAPLVLPTERPVPRLQQPMRWPVDVFDGA